MHLDMCFLDMCFFPTCQVSVVRFYVRCAAPGSSSRPLPRRRTSSASSWLQWSSPDLICQLLIAVGLAGPHLPALDRSGPCRTPTASARSGQDLPDRMPEDMRDRMSEDMPDRMTEDMPDRILHNKMPDRMSEDMPDRMSEDLTDRMSEAMPDRMSEDMPDRMSEDMPE